MADYTNYNKNELLQIINKQEKELKAKRYGLVWDAEREPEQVVLDCENNLPILKRIKSKEIRTDDSDDNILIEGDNYHALTVLNYTHKEKIDVIYIDPPYNTGNKDFIYNDRFVEKEDGYRHSKWLNFMEKRLKLAYKLLKKDGVIFISIDDNEVAQLKLLCDEIFGEENFISNITIKMSHLSGVKMSHVEKKFPKIKESLLLYSKDKNQINLQPVYKNVAWNKAFSRYKSYLEINYDEPNNIDKWSMITLSEAIVKYKSIDESIDSFYITNADKIFRTARNKSDQFTGLPKDTTFRKIITKTGLSKIAYKGEEVLFAITKLKETDDGLNPVEPLGDIWLDIGINNLHKEGGVVFKNGKKPIKLIERTIFTLKKKKITMLDFFAGSGTTGEVALKINGTKKKNINYILCTNNEEKICDNATYPRQKYAIDKYGGNLQYFKTALIKKTNNRDQVKINLTKKCTEMLCVKENIFNLEAEETDFKIFSSNKKDKFLCIYYNYIEDSFDDFLNKLKEIKGKKIIYMFSSENSINKSLFSEISNKKIEAIPQEILSIYQQLVKMNIPIKTSVIFTDFNKAKNKIFTEKDKDDGARVLRIVLEKLIQKISQDNSINILNVKGKEEKISVLNDKLFNNNIINKVEYVENRTYLTIGNNAAHGDYNDYDIKQVEKFYKHIQSLLNSYNI